MFYFLKLLKHYTQDRWPFLRCCRPVVKSPNIERKASTLLLESKCKISGALQHEPDQILLCFLRIIIASCRFSCHESEE